MKNIATQFSRLQHTYTYPYVYVTFDDKLKGRGFPRPQYTLIIAIRRNERIHTNTIQNTRQS